MTCMPRAAALRDPAGKTVVFVSTDLIGVPAGMAKFVCDAAERRHGLKRADVMISCSHTHCGPALDDKLSYMLAMKEQDWEKIRSYQENLNAKLVALIDRALDDLAPAATLHRKRNRPFCCQSPQIPKGWGHTTMRFPCCVFQPLTARVSAVSSLGMPVTAPP